MGPEQSARASRLDGLQATVHAREALRRFTASRWVCCPILVLWFFAGRVAAGADETITLDVWGLVEARVLHGTFEAAREYERRHPNVRIEIGTPGGQGYLDPQKLLTAVVAGTPPDVLWFSRHALGLWVTRGAFRPIDDLITRDGVRVDTFYPGTLEGCIWEGKTYALPWSVDGRFLFCNRRLLRQAGFTRPPRTWDELQAMAVALTDYDTQRGRYNTLGFAPNYGNAWFYLYGWQNGARWLSDDGREARLTTPEAIEALEWMVETTDAVGGAERVAAFQSSAQVEGIGDPFLSGRLAMQINCGSLLDTIARTQPDFDFEVAMPPVPREGMTPVSWSGGFAWVLPAKGSHMEVAWDFIKWMNSEEAWIIQAEAHKRLAREERGKDAHYVPFFHADRAINERLWERYKRELPPNYVEANELSLDVLDYCVFPPVTAACTALWDAQANAANDAMFHRGTPAEILGLHERRVQAVLDSYFLPPQGPLITTRQLACTTVVLNLALLTAGVLLFVRGIRCCYGLRRRRALTGVAFASPWLAGLFLFVLGPMLFSAMLAFTRYDVIHPAEFTGLANWDRMFGFHEGEAGAAVANDPQFWHGLWNTLFLVALGVPFMLGVSLGIALLLNTQVRGIHLYRTLFYVPVMVPAVVSVLIFIWLLNPETGFANYMLNLLLRPFGVTAPAWFVEPEWAKPGLILLLAWGCGGTVIIWLAGLQTLSRHLFEAARIDGAGPLQRFLFITFPLLTPYTLYLWIMGTIGMLQVFTQVYIISAPGDAALTYALYLFQRAFRYFEMGYASAMAWVLFTITVVVCVWQLRVSRRYVHYEGQ